MFCLTIEKMESKCRKRCDPKWRILSPEEALTESRILVQGIEADGITFRSNHASNYLALAGELQRDKARMLQEIEEVLGDPSGGRMRPEFMRGL